MFIVAFTTTPSLLFPEIRGQLPPGCAPERRVLLVGGGGGVYIFQEVSTPHNAREGLVPVNTLGATCSGTCCDSPFQSPACAHASQEYVVTQGAPEESLGPSKGFNPACEGTCPEILAPCLTVKVSPRLHRSDFRAIFSTQPTPSPVRECSFLIFFLVPMPLLLFCFFSFLFFCVEGHLRPKRNRVLRGTDVRVAGLREGQRLANSGI